MPRKTIAKFELEYLQIMDEKGSIDSELMPKIEKERLKELYKIMLLARTFDTKLLALQRQGRIGTFPQATGQEAAAIGPAACLEKDDWYIPSYREFAGLFLRKMPLSNVILAFSGDERGNKNNSEYKNYPLTFPIGSQLPQATGIAMGMQLEKKKNVVVVYCGDGATSEGDFHESLNFASVTKAPIIFIVQNNQYAISTPIKLQTSSQTFAQKGIAYDMPSIKVDGNDTLAMFAATQEAIQRAKLHQGPTLIEAFTYRICDHTSADDAKRYRSEEELESWKKKDPLTRLKIYLEKEGIWTEKDQEQTEKENEETIAKAIEEADALPAVTPEDMFQYMYEDMPDNLKEQLEDCKKFKKDE